MNDNISRAELFDRLATITAEDANDMKAKIYSVIQQMETVPPKVVANIHVDMEKILDRIKEEYGFTEGWIPCSERLPKLSIHESDATLGEWDNSEPVLVYHNDNTFDSHYLIAQYTNGFSDRFWGSVIYGWTEMESAEEIKDVLAWMPLPDPYESEEESE